MKIIIKYPSRGRPKRFFEGMDSILSNVADESNYAISCTLDLDDDQMNNSEVIQKIESYPHTSIQWGLSESKIHAVNRDLPQWGDIVMVMSDDMRLTFWGFDQIIRQQFSDNDFDKFLHIPDNDAKSALSTMYIAGREYYNRLGYVYHPSYKSVWADNEAQEVAKQLNKYYYVDWPGVIMHLNPAYGHYQRDEMFDEQQGYWAEDEYNYKQRKQQGFPQ